MDILCWFGDVGGLHYDALALALPYLEDIATLCWFGVFGGLQYDALALAFLYLEELNVGEPCLGVAIFGGFGGV